MKWVSEADPTSGYKIDSILSCSGVAGCYHARTSQAAFPFTFNCTEQKWTWPQSASLPLMFILPAISPFIFTFPFIWSQLPGSYWFERPDGTALNDSAGVIFTKKKKYFFPFGIDQLCSNKIGLFWNFFLTSLLVFFSIASCFTRVYLQVFTQEQAENFFSMKDFVHYIYFRATYIPWD